MFPQRQGMLQAVLAVGDSLISALWREKVGIGGSDSWQRNVEFREFRGFHDPEPGSRGTAF